MKRMLFLPILSGSLLLASAASAQELPADSTLERLARERVESGATPGLVIGVMDAAGSTRIAAHGVTRAGGPPVDEHTIFEIGSVAKVFTGTLLAEMVARGDVGLNDPVGDYLPAGVEVPARGGEITLEELSVQMSGLPRLPDNLDPADTANPYADYTIEQLHAFLSGYELPRDVGSEYEYSNLGVGLLGHALALHAGASYEDVLRDRILSPLGMAHTGVVLTPAMQERLATGHTAGGEPTANWDLPTLAGAGGIRSSMADMLRFLEANIFPERTSLSTAVELAHAPRRDIAPGTVSGLNWIRIAPFGDTLVWHNGATGGYHAFIGFSPVRRIGVVVLANASTDIDDIGMHVLDPRIPLRPPTPVVTRDEVELGPEILDRYVGRYELAPQVEMTIARGGDGLTAQLTGQPAFPIFPESKTEFFLRVVEAQLRFTLDDTGEVSGLILYQNGLEIPGRRVR